MNLGRIRDAKWVNLTANTKPVLLIVGEWLPLCIFSWEDGKLVRNEHPELSHLAGWWNCVSHADFDGDGDQDLVLGNWGLNSPFSANKDEPITLLTSDFDDNGTLDPLLFHFKQGKSVPFANRDIFTSQMPLFNKQYQNFSDYAQATLENIFPPEKLSRARFDHAYELRSVYLENTGHGTFHVTPLPWQAQLAPVNDILPCDVNHDQLLDMVLVGNLVGNHFEYGDIDALEGLVLLGDGQGNFEAVSSSQSGFRVPEMAQSIKLIKNKQSDTRRILIGNNDAAVQLFEFAPFER